MSVSQGNQKSRVSVRADADCGGELVLHGIRSRSSAWMPGAGHRFFSDDDYRAGGRSACLRLRNCSSRPTMIVKVRRARRLRASQDCRRGRFSLLTLHLAPDPQQTEDPCSIPVLICHCL